RAQQEFQGVHREVRERRVEPEKVVQGPATDVEIEIPSDLRVVFDKSAENRLVEPEHFDVAAGPDRGLPLRAVQERHLAETVARAKHVQRDLLAALARLDGTGAAGDQDVEGVRFVALPDDRVAEGKG